MREILCKSRVEHVCALWAARVASVFRFSPRTRNHVTVFARARARTCETIERGLALPKHTHTCAERLRFLVMPPQTCAKESRGKPSRRPRRQRLSASISVLIKCEMINYSREPNVHTQVCSVETALCEHVWSASILRVCVSVCSVCTNLGCKYKMPARTRRRRRHRKHKTRVSAHGRVVRSAPR